MMIFLETTPSTNTAAKQLLCREHLAHGTVVYTRCQTAGRGQRGNSWEAAPGLNVTMSLILRPTGMPAAEQFYLSEAVALGVADVVEMLLDDVSHEEVTVKWPNDIYVGDRKIAGILIENSLSGANIEWSVAGIGLNVNQREFLSDAPNPVSIFQLTGRSYPIEEATSLIAERILSRLEQPRDELHAVYRSRLWRREGYHSYATPEGREFEARIVDVAPTGHLTLATTEGPLPSFAFKEVAALL